MKREAKAETQKSYRNPLNRHILIGCILFILIFCIVMCLISLYVFQGRMMSQYESQIRQLMNLTMSRIDVEDLENCIETKNESEEYKELITFMDQVRRNYSMEYLAVVKPVKNGDEYDVMQVASGLLEEERNGEKQKEMSVPLLGDMIGEYYPEEFIHIIYDDMLNRTEIKFSASRTEFGRTYDGAVPIRNADGEGIALLTAGMTLKNIDSSMRSYLSVMLTAAIVLGALFLVFLMFWLRKRIIIPLEKIEKTAGDFAKKSHGQNKNPKALVLENPNIHTGDELESLANTLVSMSEDMKEYVEDLLDSAVKMEDMKQEIKKMHNMALKDGLTGTKNKAAYDKAKNRLDWDVYHQMADFAILMLDLNYLKKINDTYGHEKGDIYIQKMSQMVCDIFAHSPVYRIGGDEFIVILENRDLQAKKQLIDELKERMELLQRDGQLEEWEKVSAAFGLATYDECMDENVDSVFMRADKAMYENKKRMKALRED